MIIRFTLILLFLIFKLNVYSQSVQISEKFDSLKTPFKPDYSLTSSWAALPFMKDRADTTAGKRQLEDRQKNAPVDVFFIHPTSFTFQPEGINKWNGDIADGRINKITDEGTITYQASVFNGAGKIYAPRYRQAHVFSYLTTDTASARSAFEVAYEDVKNAFEYYLLHYNSGRPIILASHSQGTTHAIRLVKECFEGKPIMEQLVCAYLVGMPVYDTLFSEIKPCENENQTGCFCSWQTFAAGYYPKNYVEPMRYYTCTNPLTWTLGSEKAPARLNKGGTLRNLKKIIPGICDAQVSEGVVRVQSLNFFGGNFVKRKFKNYHVGDYNLFYINVRENAINRSKVFLGRKDGY